MEYAIRGEFFLWLILFKRSAIGTLRFETGRIFLEDMEFLSRLLVNEYRCMYLSDEQFYAWSEQAREMKKKCDREVIALDEFKDWLGKP